jgi:hypothetical protein
VSAWGSYPFVRAWCEATGAPDLSMWMRAHVDMPSQTACYYDDRQERWVTYPELPTGLRTRVIRLHAWACEQTFGWTAPGEGSEQLFG